MKLYAVIMAGGVGSRFWPRSKKKTPKQLLNIIGEHTMIQATVNRLAGFIEKENIYVITNQVQRQEVINQLSEVPEENIIEEPFGRNTAACIGLASVIIKAKDPDAVTIVLPADHIIRDEEKFKQVLMNAAKYATESKGLVTIGITPTPVSARPSAILRRRGGVAEGCSLPPLRHRWRHAGRRGVAPLRRGRGGGGHLRDRPTTRRGGRACRRHPMTASLVVRRHRSW